MMKTFAFVKNLGVALLDGKTVQCRLVTFRDWDMLIPGGSWIAGECHCGSAEVEWYSNHLPPKEVQDVAQVALAHTNRLEADAPGSCQTIPRFGEFLESAHSVEGTIYIIAFNEKAAVLVAYAAGLRPGAVAGWPRLEHHS